MGGGASSGLDGGNIAACAICGCGAAVMRPLAIADDENRMKQPIMTLAPRLKGKRPSSIIIPTAAIARIAIDVPSVPVNVPPIH